MRTNTPLSATWLSEPIFDFTSVISLPLAINLPLCEIEGVSKGQWEVAKWEDTEK